MVKNIESLTAGKRVTLDEYHGAWYVVDIKAIELPNGKHVFYELESEEFGDTVAHIIVADNGQLVACNVHNSWDVFEACIDSGDVFFELDGSISTTLA